MHSFFAEVAEEAREAVVATTHYGIDFVSACRVGSAWGVQFHPEKSQRAGLDLLGRFAALPSPVCGVTVEDLLRC